MDIRVTGRNVTVGPDVKEAIETKVSHVCKIVPGMDQAEVVFKEERNPRQSAEPVYVEITVQGHGHHVRCKANGPDQIAALDRAIDKLGKQLRKLKTRLHRHQHRTAKSAATPPPPPEPIEVEEPEAPSYRIVKTKSFELDRLTPDEAIERMHLLDHDWFLFTSDETGRPCVVYLRDDGDIGLVDAAG